MAFERKRAEGVITDHMSVGVYVAQAVETRRVKIGFSTFVSARVTQLAAEIQEPVNLLGVFRSLSYRDERAMHRKLHAFRIIGEFYVQKGAITKLMQLAERVDRGERVDRVEVMEAAGVKPEEMPVCAYTNRQIETIRRIGSMGVMPRGQTNLSVRAIQRVIRPLIQDGLVVICKDRDEAGYEMEHYSLTDTGRDLFLHFGGKVNL